MGRHGGHPSHEMKRIPHRASRRGAAWTSLAISNSLALKPFHRRFPESSFAGDVKDRSAGS